MSSSKFEGLDGFTGLCGLLLSGCAGSEGKGHLVFGMRCVHLAPKAEKNDATLHHHMEMYFSHSWKPARLKVHCTTFMLRWAQDLRSRALLNYCQTVLSADPLKASRHSAITGTASCSSIGTRQLM